MKKWILPALLLLLLTACNNQPDSMDIQANEEEGPSAEEIANEENEEDITENNDEDNQPASTNEEEEESGEEIDKPAGSEDEEESKSDDPPNEHHSKEPQYTLNPEDWSIQPINNANPKVVLLTIDDAPDRYALEMAKTLKELNVKAIFFVNGHFLTKEEDQAILKEIYDMGFPIGNHTMNHKSLRTLTEEEQYAEIVPLNDLVEEITGERPRYFRAPFGINTDYVVELAEKEGMLLMNWTYGYDWEKEYTNAEALADVMVNTDLLRDGANLLMHDREWTNDALAVIVQGLQDKGFEMLDPALIEVPVHKNINE